MPASERISATNLRKVASVFGCFALDAFAAGVVPERGVIAARWIPATRAGMTMFGDALAVRRSW